jgi:hypothetical protein
VVVVLCSARSGATFNHALLPAGTTKCAGVAPGAEVDFTEDPDKNQSEENSRSLPSARRTSNGPTPMNWSPESPVCRYRAVVGMNTQP